MKSIKSILGHPNLWIALALIAANLYTWGVVLQARQPPYVVDPIRDPEIETLLEYIYSGSHSGESWEVTLTELEAEQTITWYLDRYPQIPFKYPRVRITPDYVSGEGDATLAGLRVHVGGKARVTLKDGLPVVDILELSLPIPGPLRQAIEDEIQAQLRRAELLPVRFTSAEWREGEVLVRGYVR
ncbi:MAG: hypothetical protein JW850_16400 [Thermoflexales bacterium]|nr:hypothetical protein [Thermoflexales bacterium]